jgi:hypothetical protein
MIIRQSNGVLGGPAHRGGDTELGSLEPEVAGLVVGTAPFGTLGHFFSSMTMTCWSVVPTFSTA